MLLPQGLALGSFSPRRSADHQANTNAQASPFPRCPWHRVFLRPAETIAFSSLLLSVCCFQLLVGWLLMVLGLFPFLAQRFLVLGSSQFVQDYSGLLQKPHLPFFLPLLHFYYVIRKQSLQRRDQLWDGWEVTKTYLKYIKHRRTCIKIAFYFPSSPMFCLLGGWALSLPLGSPQHR